MAITASTRLEEIAGREAELARSLHAQFRRRLSADDTRDAVADAIVVAHGSGEELEGLDGAQLEAWVRTRAYRNAIDQIRAIDGYGAEKRKASVSVDDYAESLTDGDDLWQGVDEELAEQFSDGAAAHSVALALERLTPDERRLLRLRHYDGLDVRTIAGLLDIHPKKYERLHTRAIAKLRTIFIETTASEHCEPVRELIARSRREALAPELSAEIAAHVEACEQCRAYEKRSLKLIATLPLPAPALADRVTSRVQDMLPGFGHGETVAAGATGTAAVGAGASGTVATTGLLASIGAKTVAICSGAAVTATCVGAIAVPIVKEHNRAKKPAERAAQRKVPAKVAVQPAVAPVSTRQAITRTASTSTSKAPARKRTKARAGGGATGSIGLESFGTPTPGGSTRSATPPPPPPPPASNFSGEFTP